MLYGLFFKMRIMHRKGLFLSVLLVFGYICSSAQIYSRFQADFSIKEIGFDGKQNLMTGSLYYNKVERTIYYDFKFPEESVMIVADTCTYRPTEKVITPHNMEVSMIDFSIYNLFLNQDLDFYGLNETPYELTEVEENTDMVISTWELPGKQVKEVGKILLSQKEGRLYGLVSLDKEGNVISKQFFLDYDYIENLPFPTRVVQISYLGGQESKKITTYRNVIINSNDHKEKYNYTPDFIPVSSSPALVPVGK